MWWFPLMVACGSPSPDVVAREGGGGAREGQELARVEAAERVAWVEREAAGSALYVVDHRGLAVVRTRDGAPDRVALSADGEQLAWVASADGLPAVFTAPYADGAPVQLTNRSVRRPKGQPPVGFVPPPVREGGLSFEGDELVWEAEGQPWRVRWSSP